MTDRDVDAPHVVPTLVDDRVQREGAFADSIVPDDQLTLPFRDGNESVDDLASRVQGTMDEIPSHDRGRRREKFASAQRIRWRLPIQRITQRIDHASHQLVADRHTQTSSGQMHDCPRSQPGGLRQENGAEPFLGQMEHEGMAAVLEQQDPFHGGRREPLDPDDPVADGSDTALLHDAQAQPVLFEPGRSAGKERLRSIGGIHWLRRLGEGFQFVLQVRPQHPGAKAETDAGHQAPVFPPLTGDGLTQ